ncbi:ECF RNA polymerase sigma-E factor [Halioglobus japonicus]|nr:ECF RNA polymerase sigma-E factor [Halioglobus japonicus]
MTQDLQEIIGRAQRGDRDAFSRLVEDHYATIFRFACRYCGNRQDAEDVTQQACIKLARSLAQFRFESAFSTWLYRLVINCARDWLKSQCKRESDELDEIPVPGKQESTVLLHQVIALVDRMGEGFRESVALVLGMGMTHAEAAAILEVKESTVSWRLHEIRKRLNDQVQPGVER